MTATQDTCFAKTDLSTDPRARPTPITEEQWWDALETLPPMNWRTVAGAESFTLCEPYDMDVSNRMVYHRYVRIGNRYWEMLAFASTPIADLAELCRKTAYVVRDRNGDVWMRLLYQGLADEVVAQANVSTPKLAPFTAGYEHEA